MNILESVSFVLQHSAHVSIDRERVKAFADNFDNRVNHWLSISPFDIHQLPEAERVAFLFTLDTISFSYWGDPKWKVEYRGKVYDGAQAMLACLGRAAEEGTNFSPKYLAQLERRDLEKIFRGSCEIPLLEERLCLLRGIGEVIPQKFSNVGRSDLRYLIDLANGNAATFVDILVNNFPSCQNEAGAHFDHARRTRSFGAEGARDPSCAGIPSREFLAFQDTAQYKGREIEFHKRAQLLAADIAWGYGELQNLKDLTACADYKLPQVLRRHGILQYSDALQRKIKAREIIPAGSEEEVEIRAHTIQAVELIKKEIGVVTANQVNDCLWLEGQKKFPDDEPYHLTRTTAY